MRMRITIHACTRSRTRLRATTPRCASPWQPVGRCFGIRSTRTSRLQSRAKTGENTMGFFETLPDGWTIYVWLFAGAAIIIAAALWMRWGFKNEQFDEDIKYVIF